MRLICLKTVFFLPVLACSFLAGCASIAPHDSPIGGAEFFVAPDGSDEYPGTRQQPFQTLEHARDAIRALGGERGRAIPATVWLRGGTYFRDATFKLTVEDSGTPYTPVLYRACPGEQVRVCGGKRLEPSWCSPVTDEAMLSRLPECARGRVLQADLPANGITDYGEMSISGPMLELFCDGQRLPLARYPNEGWMHIGQVAELDDKGERKLVDGNQQGNTFQYMEERPARWRDAKDLVLHGFWWYGWMDEHVKVQQIDTGRREIALDHVPGGGIRKDQWFFALNLAEELDQPGEWYLDRASGRLYLWPPEDSATHDIIVSTLSEPLIVLEGTSNITIRGVTLEVTRGVCAVIGGGEGNRLAGCTLRGIGSQGVVVDGGKNNGLLGCDIYHTGSMAVRLTGGNRSTLDPAGNYAENCHIHHYAQRKLVYEPAVRLYGVGHRIAHNLIHDAPHQAIGYDGNDHIIEFNEIHDVVLGSADAGVLYTGCNWTFRGNVVRNNFIHGIPHGPGLGTVGVYLDDCASSTAIIGNVFYDMLKPTFIGGGRDNIIRNNIFVECECPVYLDNRGLRWEHFRPGGPMYDQLKEVRHDQPPWSERYPALARILDETPQAPLGNVVANNVSYKSTWQDPEEECRRTSDNHIDRQYVENHDNLVTGEDPGFVDAEHMDFRLRSDSIVYKAIPGFVRIPFERIGLYKDQYRASWPPDEMRTGERGAWK